MEGKFEKSSTLDFVFQMDNVFRLRTFVFFFLTFKIHKLKFRASLSSKLI